MTQDVVCEYGLVQNSVCQLRGRPGTERHRRNHCKGWKKVRLQMADQLRACEQVALQNKDDCCLR